MKYGNILLVTDPGMRHTPAFQRAVELAKRTGATLHLCLFDFQPAIAASGRVSQALMRLTADEYMTMRQRWLERQAADLSGEGVKCACSAIWGKPVGDMIIGKVIETKADIVLKDMHGRSALRRLVHTPLDWHLLRLCPAQLMLVHPHGHPPPKRVIAAVDPMEDMVRPGDLNDRVLSASLAMGAAFGAATHAVYAFEHLPPTVSPGDLGGGLGAAYVRTLEQTEAAHHEAFDKLLDRYQIPAERRHFLAHAYAEYALDTFINEKKRDLLVMGTVYRTGYEKLMLGSTAERILYRVDSDVLVVKAPGFVDEVVSKYRGELDRAIDYGKLAA